MEEIFQKIRDERKRQNEKWGVQHHPGSAWLTILMEEVGEVAKAMLEKDDVEIVEEELIQATAVCVAWLEDLKRGEQR